MEQQQKPKSIEGTFPKSLENIEIRNEWNEMKKWKKKLIEMIWYMNQVNTNMVLEMFQKHDLSVTIIVMVKLQEVKLINRKPFIRSCFEI